MDGFSVRLCVISGHPPMFSCAQRRSWTFWSFPSTAIVSSIIHSNMLPCAKWNCSHWWSLACGSSAHLCRCLQSLAGVVRIDSRSSRTRRGWGGSEASSCSSQSAIVRVIGLLQWDCTVERENSLFFDLLENNFLCPMSIKFFFPIKWHRMRNTFCLFLSFKVLLKVCQSVKSTPN